MSSRILIALRDDVQQTSLGALAMKSHLHGVDGFDVADSLEKAVRHVRMRQYSMVIGGTMPDGDAQEILQATRSYNPEAEFVVSSRMWDDPKNAEAIAGGAWGPICAPFDDTEIHQVHTAEVLRAAHRGKFLRQKNGRDHSAFLRPFSADTQAKLTHLLAQSCQDHERSKHVKGVGKNTEHLGERMGWSKEAMLQRGAAATLHDFGKRMISPDIIMKAGPLTDAERAAMQQHVIFGKRIMELMAKRLPPDAKVFMETAVEATGQHHEKWNGSGYPSRLSEGQISPTAAVVAVADVFDALQRPRVYKAGMPKDVAASIIIKDKGAHFKPEVVEVFEEMIAN
jgi:putative two-component system response regulator